MVLKSATAFIVPVALMLGVIGLLASKASRPDGGGWIPPLMVVVLLFGFFIVDADAIIALFNQPEQKE